MKLLSLLWCLAVLAPVIVESRPQYRQRIQPSAPASRSSGSFRGRGRGGGRRRRPRPVVKYEEYDDGTDYGEVEVSSAQPPAPVEVSEEAGEEAGCGEECRNLVHQSDHRKEDSTCPYEGMVIDIWGYCRYIYHQERRDWAWWESLRNYIYSNGNSW